ncbi:ArnT family glycosyltransferase [Providencia manganoxydans]|uniref:ArnT family glycosyltransferase n=1 Tax=Providencia manganoxydans TaxID=2923283 RepID=UPI0034E3E4FA
MQKLSLPKNLSFILFVGFLIIYLLPGIYGHTPWKQDENYSFGIIQTMFETGNWLVPTNAGEPFMEKPPLYYWVATITSHLLSGFMPLYDAARSASLLFMVVNFSFFILLARRAFNTNDFNDKRIWIAFALYVCAPGILRHSHDMFTDVALITGATIGLYGIQGLIRQEKIIMSALWLMIGTVITMLSKGLFVPGVLWLSLLLAPIFLPQCRQKMFWLPAIIAGLVALLLILPWPILLYRQHPDLFITWIWENNIGRFLGFSVEKLGAKANLTRIPSAIAFFALPSGILAVLYFFRNPLKRLHNPNIYLVTMFPLLGILLLQISASGRALYLLPFIASLAILGTHTLLRLPEKILRIFSHFSAMLWSLLIIFLWACYFVALADKASTWLAPFGRWLPMSYQMSFSIWGFIGALFLTTVWFSRSLFVSPQIALRAIQNWALGMCIVWGVILSLFVGWIDYSKGFETVFVDLNQQLKGNYKADDCMASDNIGESEAPMLYYYTKILHQRQDRFEKPEQCRWLIVLSKQINPPPSGMTLFWTNHRPDEFTENLVVYKAIE